MKRRLSRRGFSLIELIISMSLSTLVMIGIISVSASMVRYQFEGVRKGGATGQSLYAIHRLQKELEDATHIELPLATAPSDALSGCTNWSEAGFPPLGPQIDPLTDVVAFYYCKTTAGHPSFPNSLVRYQKINATPACPFATVPAVCGNAVAGATMEVIVYNAFFYLDAATSVFSRAAQTFSDEDPWVQMRFTIGNSTPTTNVPIPVFYKFNTRVHTNKAYGISAD